MVAWLGTAIFTVQTVNILRFYTAQHVNSYETSVVVCLVRLITKKMIY